MSVLTLSGKKINWKKPPKPTARVMWSQKASNGKKVTGSLRTIAHLDHLNTLAKKKFGKGLVVIQPPYNTGVPASAGTHDFDACSDIYIPGVGWREQESFFRANGFACWWRRPPSFGHHIHGFTLPPHEGVDRNDDFKMAGFKVGLYVDGGWATRGAKVASSQIGDYYDHRTGLSGHAKADGWFPPNIKATIFNLNAYISRQAGGNPTEPAPVKKSLKKIAKEVIAGKWGNGATRTKRLRAAGYNPAKVQAKVNKMLSAGSTTPSSPNSLRVDGVDISHWQSGSLNMKAAKAAGVKWVAHKATEGETYRDPNYTKRRKEAKDAGLVFGAYHFARPSKGKGDATREANFFLSVAKPKVGDLRPTLDIEVTDGLSMAAVRSWVSEFSNAIHKALGVRPIIYTQSSWDLGAVEKSHTMWRARYNNDNRPPVRAYDIHQFSNGVYGKPNKVAGFGNVDLNTMRKGLTLASLRIPKTKVDPEPKPTKTVAQIAREVIDGKWGNGADRIKRLKKAGYNPTKVQNKVNAILDPPKPPEPKKPTATLKFAHVSMQFSDTAKQMEHDVAVIFNRGYDVITGTEAGHGSGKLLSLIKTECKKRGYKLSKPGRYDTWVAVKKSLVQKGSWKKGSLFALWRSSKTTPKPPGRWGDKGIVWARWNMGPTFGRVAVGAVHNLTWRGAGDKYKNESDIIYAEKMEQWRKSFSDAVECFIGGDFNRSDKTNDVFRGKAKFLTAGDELKKWPNTGHGPIDAIAREKGSKRVECVRYRALNDKKLFLNTDHFLIEADYRFTAL